MTMATITGLTIEDFENLPDVLARNHELVDGELVKVSANSIDHNRLRDAIVVRLDPYVREHKLGCIVAEQEYDFGGNAHGPDVSFFGPEKARLVEPKRRVQPFVPDLAIEVVSPSDKFESLLAKAQRYRRCGTKEVFIFSIQLRQVFVFSEHSTVALDETQDFRPEQIPGFSIRISDLLAMI
ncbi:conserved hypothetical protein [Candidatus Sulfopaludibacter sp. SbA4]|nr:conserved hypothetical protein [Candidatus Sulfopaludibacter sp. SbA4]